LYDINGCERVLTLCVVLSKSNAGEYWSARNEPICESRIRRGIADTKPCNRVVLVGGRCQHDMDYIQAQ